MSLPVPTTIATGFGGNVGCAYRRSTDQLLIVDSTSPSTIYAVNAHTHVKTVIGTGYTALHDIALSADGLHAYLAESPGSLLRVALASANRASATVVASGLNGAEQIALDEAHGFAYVAEFTAGQLQRINLADGTRKAVVTGVFCPYGLLVTSDGRFAYVSDQLSQILRFDLESNTHTVIASGLNGPRFLTWADAGESVILFPQANPTGTVCKLDLTASAAVTAIAGPTPPDVRSVAVLSPEQLLITSHEAISHISLTDSVYSPAGPILLGIEFVPADIKHLPGGYADTSKDSGYFFYIKDAPFGGTLPLMINHDHARNLSPAAAFYQVFITAQGGAPVMVQQPFSDYRWSVALNQFELVTRVPTNGYYPVRAAGEIWLNYWLGLLLDTTGQPNGLNTISVKLFSAQSAASEIGHSTDTGRSATVMIDNTVPTARIEQILHDGLPVNTCAIVNSGSHTFTFGVTASAPRHLRGWALVAYWGDNQSKSVSGDDYSAHASTSHIWTGLSNGLVPPPGPTPWDATVANDQTSIHCAHLFSLSAWDRVINGWGYIHDAAYYNKSITLYF